MVFNWSLRDSKSPGLFSVFWPFSIMSYFGWSPCIPLFSSPPVPLVNVPKAIITIGRIVTFLFHSFFQFPRKFQILILLFIYFQFYSVVSRDSNVHNFAISLFLLIIIMSGRLAEIKWSVCMWKSRRDLCVSFSRTDVGLCIYHLFVWSNWNFLLNSQWITLHLQSCLVLHSFCANLLHLLIIDRFVSITT